MLLHCQSRHPSSSQPQLVLDVGRQQLRLRHWAVPLPGAPASGPRQPLQLPPLSPHQVLLLQEHLLRLCALLLPVLQWFQRTGSGG